MATTWYVGVPTSGDGDGSSGNPFASIQAAIDASASGDTVDIADGSYTGALNVTHGLAFVGHGEATILLNSAVTAGIDLTGVDLAGETVSFTGLTIEGSGLARIGIRTASGSDVGGLVLDDVRLEGFIDYGILTNPQTLDGITITGSTFEDNGTSTVSGATHVHLWGFDGDGSITDVTITGSDGPPTAGSGGTNPEFAIQFTGRVNESIATQTSPEIGTVTIDGLVIQGGFAKNAVGIFNYSNLDGLTISGDGIDLTDALAGWNLVNVDGILGDVPADEWVLDLPSGVVVSELQGDKINQSLGGGEDRDQEIVGTAAADRLIGKGGDDTLYGGQGDDEIYGHDKSGGAQTVDGGEDHLFGGQGNDLLYGGNGDDRLSGDLGSDYLDGGAGVDTAVFSTGEETLTGADSMISFSGGVWYLTDGLDTDTLTGVEKVEIDGNTYLLVDTVGAAFQSIEDALDAAAEGDTILLAPGDHDGAVIDKSVTVAGLPGAIVKGVYSTTNGIDLDTTNVADWLKTATAYTGTGPGLTIDADDVTLRDLTIEDHHVGIELKSNDGLTIADVTIANTVMGIRKEAGLAIDVTNFTLTDGEIRDSYIGMDINAHADGSFDQVTIDGTHFENLTAKGIYVEQLSNATISDVTMQEVGEFGRGPTFGPTPGAGGAGIDINLKYGDYANITVEGFELTDVGRSNLDGVGSRDPFGAAIVVRARDDAPSYSSDPATLDNIVIRDGSIDGTSTAVRIGEPGKTNLGPTNATVENVSIDDAPDGAVDNRSQAVLEVTGTSGGDLIDAHDSSTGAFDIDGSGGADTLTGGPGADTFDGGDGSDLLVLSGNRSDYDVSYSAGLDRFTIIDLRDGNPDGTDIAASIESFEFQDTVLSAAQLLASSPTYADALFFSSDLQGFGLSKGLATGFGPSVFIGSPGAGWELTGAGDFDGDGDADLLWWNSALDGAARSEIDGLTTPSTAWIGTAGAGHAPQLIVDIDSDGTDDVVWRTPDGSSAIVDLGGTGNTGVPVSVGGDWVLATTADVIGGDGVDELVWTSDALNGVAISGTGDPSDPSDGAAWYDNPGAGWELFAAADLAGDGRDDFIWWNESLEGAAISSHPAGSSDVATTWIGSPGDGWELIGAAQFGTDQSEGMLELLWWNDSLGGAATSELALNGATEEISIVSFEWVGGPGAGWAIDRVVDLDLDGIDEILWYNGTLDGYAVTPFEDTEMESAIWLGNLGPDNWTIVHVDEFVL